MIRKSMIKHPLFVYTWPIIAIAIQLILWPFLYDAEALRYFDAYIEILSLNWGKVYFGVAFPVLVFSYVLWFKKHSVITLLFTMFTTWVLCGLPGICFANLLAWKSDW